MAENTNENVLPSVFSFSEDVSGADAPIPLPAGKYNGEIAAVEAKVSKSGNTYADITVKIEASAYPVDWAEGEENPDGLALHYRRVTIEDTKASRFRLRRFTEKAGLPAVGRDLDLNNWIGHTVKVLTKIEKGQDGLDYAVVDELMAP